MKFTAILFLGASEKRTSEEVKKIIQKVTEYRRHWSTRPDIPPERLVIKFC